MRCDRRWAWWLLACLVVLPAPVVRADQIPSGRGLAPEVFDRDREAKDLAELDQAVECFQRRDYEQTLVLLKAAVRKHAALPPARLLLARLFLATNQLPLGRATLEEAAAENPEYPGIYLGFGNLALAEGRLTDALLHFDKAAALAQSGPWAEPQKRYCLLEHHAGRAGVAEGRKDWPAARTALLAWLELDPKNGKARQRLARALLNLNQTAEGLEELEQAVRDDPALDPAAVTMGWFYNQQGDRDKAAQWMERAVQQAPTDAKAHLGLATWLLQQDQPERAKGHADTAAQLDPSGQELKLLRGLIALHLKDFAQAERHLEAAYQGAPGSFAAGNHLALALAQQPARAKQERALKLAEQNTRAYPQSTEAVSTLGWVYYRLGKLNEAERALNAAVAGGTATCDTAYFLAHVFADRGRTDEAKKILQAAVAAPGSFLFRKEARAWLEKIAKKPQ